MKKLLRYAAALALLTGALAACDGSKNDPSDGDVNLRMYQYMHNYYLWNGQMPTVTSIPDSDPYAFFSSLKYRDDKWSVIVDEASDLIGSITNEGLSFGWGLSFWYMQDIGEIWAQVLYVHDGTAAASNNLVRGDLITRINGSPMTEDGSATDYRQLLYATSITVTATDISGGSAREVSMTAATTYLDPIIDYRVITKGASKIGYLFYSDFVKQSENDLKSVFSYFKGQGITDLILDLRYNGGGTSSTSLLLGSLIAPKTALDGNHIYSKLEYNDTYSEYLRGEGVLEEYTIDYLLKESDVPQNLNLPRVYVLTGSGTASASEQTIIGLAPYMDVYMVGGETHGKFVGGTVMPAKMSGGNMVPDRSTPMGDWCMYIMMFWYSNGEGYPGANVGLSPEAAYFAGGKTVSESWNTIKAVGDESDAILADAINHITTGAWLPSQQGVRGAGKGERHLLTITPGVPTGTLVREIPLPVQ